MPSDRAKSRERKLKRLQEQWSGRQGFIYQECELCGTNFVVNNWPDKKPRTPRLFKRIICPWCSNRRGRRRMIEHIVFERIAYLSCLNNWGGDPHDDDPVCKCVRCIANRVIIADRKKELRASKPEI